MVPEYNDTFRVVDPDVRRMLVMLMDRVQLLEANQVGVPPERTWKGHVAETNAETK